MFMPFTICGYDACEIPQLPGSDDTVADDARHKAWSLCVQAWVEANPDLDMSDLPDFNSEPLPLVFGLCEGMEVVGILVFLGQVVNGFTVHAGRTAFLENYDAAKLAEIEAESATLQVQTVDDETYTVIHAA